MAESILTSVKKSLGIAEEYEHFDADIIMHINSVFNILAQLGVRDETGFAITGSEETWSEFTSDNVLLNSVKSYVCLKVRLLFDPPTSSAVMESIQRLISELEWRLNVTVDTGDTTTDDTATDAEVAEMLDDVFN